MHWVASHLSFEEAKYKKENENDCKYQLYNIRRNKGKHLEQVPHCYSYFVAMLVFLVFVSSSFQLGPNSLIAIIVCGHSPSILQPQGTVYSLK